VHHQAGVAVGLPGPVDVAAGAVTWASRMPRWRGFAARAVLSSQLAVPVAVDNDANLLALGESRLQPPGDTLVVVKAGTGIGSGLVIEGRLHRGRVPPAGYGFRSLVAEVQHIAEPDMRLDKARSAGDGTTIRHDRFGVATLCLACHAQIVMRGAEVGVQRNRLFEAGDRRIEPVRSEIGVAEIVLGSNRAGAEFDSSLAD